MGSGEELAAPVTGTAACHPEGDYVTLMPLDSSAAATHADVPSPVSPDEKAASGSDTSGGLTMSQVASGPSEAQAGDCDTAGGRVESRTATVAGSTGWTKRKGSSGCMEGKDRVKVTNLSSKPLSSSQLSLLSKGLGFVPVRRQKVTHLLAELKEWERLMRQREFWSAYPQGQESGAPPKEAVHDEFNWPGFVAKGAV